METIFFGNPDTTHHAPLLFIHGSYCSASIWQRYFLPYFEKEGFFGAAISLSGHGKNDDRDNLDNLGLADFLDDIEKGVHLFDTLPILVGHSMGGYLVQRYALEHDVPGLILLSSPALTGLFASSQHIMMNDPPLVYQLGLLMTCGPQYADIDIIGQALCSGPMTNVERQELAALLQPESKRVSSELMWPCWTQPKAITPTLVLGGDKDVFVPVSDFRYSAATWDGTLNIMPNVPHAFMMDQCWPTVANEIKNWLVEQTVIKDTQSQARHNMAQHCPVTVL
ncbi:MAG: alpha/beta hydrolase [Alphaproteobacteria bacterium]|nr:alpha/beta hydrolase [Alphaproteobacteria bacterium]